MSCGTDGKEFGEAFNNPQEQGKQVIVQVSSDCPVTVLQKMVSVKLRRMVRRRGAARAIQESRYFASLRMTTLKKMRRDASFRKRTSGRSFPVSTADGDRRWLC